MERQELLRRIHESRQKFDAIVSHLDEAEMTNLLPGSRWTIKDLVGHVGFWEQRTCNLYYTLVDGKEPEQAIYASEVDLVNERSYQENAAKSLLQVQREEAEAFRSILAIAENAPEADLYNGNRFPWTGGTPFYQIIIDNTFGHYDEHLNDLIAASQQKPARG